MLGRAVAGWTGRDSLQHIGYELPPYECRFGVHGNLGAGEHIMRIGLARAIADALRPVSDRQDGREEDIHESLTRTLSTHFYGQYR